MNGTFLEENRRKSRMRPLGRRSNECVSLGAQKKCRPLAIGRLSRALLFQDNPDTVSCISPASEQLNWNNNNENIPRVLLVDNNCWSLILGAHVWSSPKTKTGPLLVTIEAIHSACSSVIPIERRCSMYLLSGMCWGNPNTISLIALSKASIKSRNKTNKDNEHALAYSIVESKKWWA